jgi:hypothetical protein
MARRPPTYERAGRHDEREPKHDSKVALRQPPAERVPKRSAAPLHVVADLPGRCHAALAMRNGDPISENVVLARKSKG